jgi:hypothetical protein
VEQPRPKRPGPGRPPKPVKVVPPELSYATVRKRREKGHVVEVVRTLVFGVLCLLVARLKRSTASTTINTSFVERNNGTDRHQNARKRRKTYAFSKDLAMHRAASYFVGYSYNFCWAVRTLRTRKPGGSWQARTPAMAAGLSDYVWTIEESLRSFESPALAGAGPRQMTAERAMTPAVGNLDFMATLIASHHPEPPRSRFPSAQSVDVKTFQLDARSVPNALCRERPRLVIERRLRWAECPRPSGGSPPDERVRGLASRTTRSNQS